MDYYRNIVTEKSWRILQELRKDYQFVLIGGWAVWLYAHAFKSKDIDIIVDMKTLTKIKMKFPVTKNNRLCKYEAVEGEVQIDIYVPYWSNLGIPAEKIQSHAITREGFRVPPPETLLVLKQVAYSARAGSSKGYKDFLDMINLISLPQFNWKHYQTVTNHILVKQLPAVLSHTTHLPELGLNAHQLAKKKKEWLNALENFKA